MSFSDQKVMRLTDPKEPPLWIAFFAIAIAIAAPILLLSLSHL